MFMKKLFTMLACCLLAACATSPTGRMQMTFMPDAEMNQMGAQAFTEIKQQTPVSRNHRYNSFVSCISNAITRQVGGNWEVVVFQDDSLNAFALPGNKIGVHTGLVNLVDNQDQLAAVIGHEVGHVLAKHSNERMSQEAAVKQGLQVIGAVAAPQSAIGQLGVAALGIGAQFGILLPYSRAHESESDIIGLDLMAKAGFDPRQSVVLWQKMSRASKGASPPEFLSTHPAHDTRIQELSRNVPAAMRTYQQAQARGQRPNCRK